MRYIDLTGQKFNRLLVLSQKLKNGYDYAWCRCDCGVEKWVRKGHLIRKNNPIISCGCYKKEVAGVHSITHGKSNTKVYLTWQRFRSRCDNKNNNRYYTYGARGITYDDRWRSFENFYDDMGDPPTSKHSLERIDNNGNYCKDNCRWATHKEQANNRSNTVFVEINGVTKTIMEWCRHNGFNRALVTKRLKRGWSMEDAITTPSKRSNK